MSNQSNTRTINIRASISRHYGNVTVTFGMDEYIDVSSGAMRRDAMNNLVEQINDQHDVYASEFLHKEKNYGATVDFKKPDAGKIRVEANKLVCEVKGGKRYFSFICAGYQKFGVRVWDDVLQPSGLMDELGDNFAMDMRGVTLTVDTLSKPHKVIRIERQ